MGVREAWKAAGKFHLLFTPTVSSARGAPTMSTVLVGILLLSLLKDVVGLYMEEHVIPPHVLLGESTDLVCRYRLQNQTLYSVKWYKNMEEFYQFIASPKITKRMFPLPGIRVNLERSNTERVHLVDVDFSTSGKYGCEVSVDAPSFNTVISIGHMLVIAFPEKPPRIEGGKDVYAINDELNVNCTAERSKPAVLLNWHINGKQAPAQSLVQYPVQVSPDGRETRLLGLKLMLQPVHFAASSAGRLTLLCTASIASLYRHDVRLTVRKEVKHAQPPAKTLEVKEPSGAVRLMARHPSSAFALCIIIFLANTR